MYRYITARTSEISKGELILTGASAIRDAFTSDQMPLVLEGYMEGLNIVFAMTIAIVGTALVIACKTRWTKLDVSKVTGGGA